MSVPSGTKFIGISSSVDTLERKSTLANSPSQVYTIEDIVDSVDQVQNENILWTIDMVDSQSVTVYAPYTMVFTYFEVIYAVNEFDLAVTVNGSPYVEEQIIDTGDAIGFSVTDVAVINFGVYKL